MAEHRKPCLSLLMKVPGDKSTSQKVELYPAQAWEELYPQEAYRVRLNGKWFDNDNGADRFYSPQALSSIIESIQSNLLSDSQVKDEGLVTVTPDMVPRGTRIRVFCGDWECPKTTFVTLDPFKGKDGEIYVYAMGILDQGGRSRPVRLHEIQEVL